MSTLLLTAKPYAKTAKAFEFATLAQYEALSIKGVEYQYNFEWGNADEGFFASIIDPADMNIKEWFKHLELFLEIGHDGRLVFAKSIYEGDRIIDAFMDAMNADVDTWNFKTA